MSNQPAIYWQEKAKVCERAFIQELQLGHEREAIRNLFRMSYALNMRDACNISDVGAAVQQVDHYASEEEN